MGESLAHLMHAGRVNIHCQNPRNVLLRRDLQHISAIIMAKRSGAHYVCHGALKICLVFWSALKPRLNEMLAQTLCCLPALKAVLVMGEHGKARFHIRPIVQHHGRRKTMQGGDDGVFICPFDQNSFARFIQQQ